MVGQPSAILHTHRVLPNLSRSGISYRIAQRCHPDSDNSAALAGARSSQLLGLLLSMSCFMAVVTLTFPISGI